MPLTPADVHNVAFKKPPIGKRGYDEDEVDEFLDLIEAEFARLIEENNDLKGQIEGRGPGFGDRSDAAATSVPTAGGAATAAADAKDADQKEAKDTSRGSQPPAPLQDDRPPVAGAAAAVPAPAAAKPGRTDAPAIHAQALRMLELAQETAERHTTEAKAESDRVRQEAHAEVERLITEARTKADALHGDARNRAETLERDARTKAAALTSEAERRHADVMGNLERRKGSLEKAISELRAFEREYRDRLKTWLESELRDLADRPPAEPDGGPPAGSASGSANGAQAAAPHAGGVPGGSGAAGSSASYGAHSGDQGRPGGSDDARGHHSQGY